jgi:RNA-directed DNA polymerase
MNISSLKHLAFLLKCKASKDELILLCNSLSNREFLFDDNFYRERREISEIKKGRFKTRILNPTKGRLKLIQSKIKTNILDNIQLPYYVQGGRKGCSNITNATLHLGNKFKFTTDIKGFFPSVTPVQVYKSFSSHGIKPEIARVLTLLTTFKGVLPQGAPSSSHVANLAFLPIDEIIYNYCITNDLTYSRFIDDITISSKKDFKNQTLIIISIMDKAGFKISSRKTHYAHIVDITGIETGNNGLKPNKKFFKRLEESPSDASKIARMKYLDRVKAAKKVRRQIFI